MMNLVEEDVKDAFDNSNIRYDEVINRAVNISESMLVSEICVTSNGSTSSFAKLLLLSILIDSNTVTERSQKRKRNVPVEHNIIQKTVLNVKQGGLSNLFPI